MSQQLIDIRRIKSNMNVRIKLKTDTLERYKQFNPVLYESEPAIVKCENGDRYLVIGDGVHNVMDLDCIKLNDSVNGIELTVIDGGRFRMVNR